MKNETLFESNVDQNWKDIILNKERKKYKFYNKKEKNFFRKSAEDDCRKSTFFNVKFDKNIQMFSQIKKYIILLEQWMLGCRFF